MPMATIEWLHGVDGVARLVDQTRLPGALEFIECKEPECMWEAIRSLKVRGAPALGIAGALGILLGLRGKDFRGAEELISEVEKTSKFLGTSRPTAVNLFWALDRMKNVARDGVDLNVGELRERLLREALAIIEEDQVTCRNIGKNGAELLPDPSTVLTHCNAGGLATADYGTALGVIFAAKEMGKSVSVFADETRPLFQGARLTTWELMQAGIDVTLICDNMAGWTMKSKKIDCVVVGADRIARNGDTANKIGTYSLAVLAKEHGVPFYVAAPISTIDPTIKSGEEIPIEERSGDEITCPCGVAIAPEGVKTFSPAFDVTPSSYVDALITEKEVIRNPDEERISALLASA